MSFDATQIAEDEALIAQATEGPYTIEPINDGETYQITTSETTGFVVICETESGQPQDLLNMEFQVAARTRWPLYVEEVKRLRELLDRARPYVSGAYECAFPDAMANEELLSKIDAAMRGDA